MCNFIGLKQVKNNLACQLKGKEFARIFVRIVHNIGQRQHLIYGSVFLLSEFYVEGVSSPLYKNGIIYPKKY